MDTILSEKPTDLQIAQGDATSVPEFDAWGAFQTLRSPSPEFDRPLDDAGTTPRAIAKKRLSSYVAERSQYGRPLFPSETAKANKARAEYHRAIFTKPLAEALPPESAARIESRAKLASDPDRYRARQVVKSYLNDVFGTSIPPEQYDHARTLYARQHLGLKDDTSDKAVFSAVKERYAARDATEQTLAQAFETVAPKILTGDIDPAGIRAKWAEVAPTIPDHLREAAESEFLANYRRTRELRRQVLPAVRRLDQFVRQQLERGDAAQPGDTAEALSLSEAADFLNTMPPDQRNAALGILGDRIEKLPEDQRDTLARAWAGAVKTDRALGRDMIEAAGALLFHGTASAAGISAEESSRFPEYDEGVRARKALSGIIGGKSVFKASDNWLQMGIVGATGQVPNLALFFSGPAGLTALGTAMGGDSYTAARLETPEANPGTQLAAATVSGGAQLGVEFAFTKTGLALFKGRMPGLAGMMNRAGISSPMARLAIGGTTAATGAAAVEYTEEVAQATIDRFLQDTASQLSDVDPDTDWQKFFADWNPASGSRQSRETLAAVIPYALIGSGAVGSFRHFRYGDYLRKNATLLRAIGVPEAKVQEIVTATDIAAADVAMKEAFQEGLETRTAEHRAEAVAVLEEQAKLMEAAGFPVVTEESNSFTEETAHVFASPDGTREEFATRDEALEAWRSWSLQQSEADLDTLAEAANQDVIEFLTAEGTVSEETLVEGQNVAMTPAEAVRRGIATPEQMRARLEIFALQEGRQAKAEDLRLFARRFSDIARDGTYRGVVQYFRGADPLNIVEDLAEDAWNRGLDGGALTGPELVGYIRQTEDATGQRYLADGYEYADSARMPLLEALSKVSTEYILGKSKAESLPERFRAWLDMIVAVAAATFRHARTLARSGNLMAAVKAGKIDARFERLVADSVGLNTEAIERRVLARHEQQLAADAMGGFPEIGEAARGELPHPETLRKQGHPLAGEVRRIFDSLKTTTKRRRKDGTAVDGTQRANAYFLPVGEMVDLDDVRERMNSRGFDFLTPADMLDALDTSLSFGKPVYGTATAEAAAGASFSIGGATITPGPDTRSFPGADGSPSVIGPASFSIGAYHGTPHKVDRFRTDRIGTGEGAQAYGWGLYFSESPAVAEEYRKILGSEFRLDGGVLMRAGMFGPKFAEMRQALGEDATDIIVAFLPEGKAKVIDELNNPLSDIDEATFERAVDFLDRIEATNSGNLYRVNLKPDAEAFLDWDKPFSQQPATIQSALMAIAERSGGLLAESIQPMERGNTTGQAFHSLLVRSLRSDKPGNRSTVTGPAFSGASDALLAAGIRGIRYLDGASRDGGPAGTFNFVVFDAADIEILEENGQPVDTASFSLSPKGIERLESAIAKKLTAAPEERATFYQRLRDRLASLTLRLEDMDRGLGPFARKDTDTAGEERRRIRDAYAEARAIVDTLPAEARGRVSISLDDITAPTTERGRVNALVRLIEQADDALETVLKREYLDAFETLLDLAKPDLRQNKGLRGRLTPETQKLVGKVQDAIELDAATAAIRIHNQQLAMQELADRTPATPEEAAALETELTESVENLGILETFSAMGTRSAAELSHAFEQLETIYTRGRTARRILDESRRRDLEDQKREVLASLPRVTQATWSKRTADKGLGDLAESFRLGLSSFHQVMESIFPNSTTARAFQERIRKADRAFVRAKIDARERFESFMRSAFDLSGPSARRRGNRILADISKRRDDWNIEIREGVKMEPVALSPEQAQAILAGTLKPGWESDLIAMESLRQAYADFKLARLRDQSRAQFVRFSRLTSRGTPTFLDLSDLEAVYFLQLHAQEMYRPALDRYGFTAAVIEKIRAKIDPRALEVAGHLKREYAAEYDRLNPTFRALFGMDMPRIRNYAPGLFEHLDTKGEASQLDPYGNPATPVNAMAAGFTKSRTHHMARPRQANALAAYWSHLEATEYFISYGETMRDARQIFRNPDVRRSIENAFGTRAAGVFSQWLDAIEVDGRFRAANMAALQEMTTRALATQSGIGLAYNVGTLFKQASAAFGVFMEMPTGPAIRGLMQSLANPRTLAHVWKQEAVQQRIIAGMSPEDKRLLDAAEASPSIAMDLLEAGRLPIAWADAAFTTVAGAAAYNYHRAQALKNGMSEARAETVALEALDRVVTRTAQPATTQDRSLAEVAASGFGRFLFVFRSDPRQKLAISLAALRGLATGTMGKAEAGRRLLWAWAFYGLMAEIMTDVWQGMSRDEDDPERWAVSDYLASALAGPLSGLPLLGSGIEMAIRSTVGTKAYSNSANPIDNAVAKIFRDGFTSSTWRVVTAEDAASLEDVLNAALRDTAALAQLAGAIDPRAAIVPAGLRLARDTAGLLGNAAKLVTGESEADRHRKIIEEERKADSEATKLRADQVKATARELEELPEEARERRLAEMDPRDRSAIEARLRRRELSDTERGLASLSVASRAAAIGRILATLPAQDREPFLDRLRAVRILTRATEAALATTEPPPAP